VAKARKIVKGLLYSVFGMGVAVALTACSSSSGTAAPASSTAVANTADVATAAQTSAATAEQQGSAGALSNLTSALSAASSLVAESKNDSTAAAGTGSEADCPLSAADISAVTSMSWQFEEYQAARPLESDETVMTTVCGFTAPDVVDEYGDPAFLRTDVFTGADAAKAQADYASGCPEFGGVLQQFSTPTAVGCARNDVVVDAQVGDGTRLVQVWINTSKDKQAELAAAWEPLLAAVN
jgi:hypothetical protein